MSTKELANSFSMDAEVYGSGWGVEAKASFSYKKSFSLKEDEVVLRATHSSF